MRAQTSAPRVRVLDVGSALDRAAEIVTDVVRQRADAAIGLATGSSVEPVYERLVPNRSSFGDVHAFALDEYLGLAAGHPRSYRSTLLRAFAEPLGVSADRLAVPDAQSSTPTEAATAYEDSIRRAGGIGVQLLGIGSNGHIGFNEPGTSWSSRTHVVELAASTRRDNQRFFPHGTVPTHALTQGIATILEARKLVLLAFGRAKARAVRSVLEEPRDTAVPASALWWHDDVELLIDSEAASLLS
jgi:glucosamine-6-phosphate deaminase